MVMEVGKTAFLFPGQGSQHVGMGKGLSDYSGITSLYETASEVVGFDIEELMLEGPEEDLSLTENAQPAIFTDSVARYRILIEKGIYPDCLVGHSLGEFSAVVAAGCLTFSQGIELVKKRGDLTGDIDVEGSMVAVLGIDYRRVEDIVGQLDAPVTVANYNSPKQTVISGREKDLAESCSMLKEADAKCIQLDVTGPFHSPFMEKAEEELKRFIERYDFKDPEYPVLSGVSGAIETEGERLQELLTRQMTHPVKWVDYVKALMEYGVERTIEVGSGPTLTRLTKRIAPELDGKRFNEVV